MDPMEALLTWGVYATLGVLIGLLYHWSPDARESSVVHLATAFVILIASVITLSRTQVEVGSAYDMSWRGFLFFGTSLCYAPVLVYLALFYWNRWIVRLTSSAQGEEKVQRQLTPREEWKGIQHHLESLRRNPLNVFHREQLAQAYLRLGFVESAVSEYLKAADCLDHGYEQSVCLFKASRLLIDQKQDLNKALPVLRRILRVYPKSYFASYARRIVNHYEAHGNSAHSPRRL